MMMMLYEIQILDVFPSFVMERIKYCRIVVLLAHTCRISLNSGRNDVAKDVASFKHD